MLGSKYQMGPPLTSLKGHSQFVHLMQPLSRDPWPGLASFASWGWHRWAEPSALASLETETIWYLCHYTDVRQIKRCHQALAVNRLLPTDILSLTARSVSEHKRCWSGKITTRQRQSSLAIDGTLTAHWCNLYCWWDVHWCRKAVRHKLHASCYTIDKINVLMKRQIVSGFFCITWLQYHKN